MLRPNDWSLPHPLDPGSSALAVTAIVAELHFDDPRYAEADHKLDVAGEEQDKVWLQRLTTRARLCFTLGTFS